MPGERGLGIIRLLKTTREEWQSDTTRLMAGTVCPIYAVVCVSGLARSFLQPARTALAAEIVPRETYTNAITWRSSLWQFAAGVGPAAGGILYGFSGPRLAYIVETVLCAVALVFGGLVTLGVVGVTAWKIPRLRDLNELA